MSGEHVTDEGGVWDEAAWQAALVRRAREALAARHTADRVARRIALDYVDTLLDEGAVWGWQPPVSAATAQRGSD